MTTKTGFWIVVGSAVGLFARCARWGCGVIVGASVIVGSETAYASQACPTTQTSNASLLKIYGYDMNRFNTGSFTKDVYVGNFMFYGTSVVGAVVVEEASTPQFATCNLYVITDANNNLLGGLPLWQNYLCLGDASQHVEVINANVNAGALGGSVANCSALSNVTMTPLAYFGNGLFIMGLGSADHIHGGAAGADVIYGGSGDDDLDGQGDALSAQNAYDVILAEEGNDFVYSGSGDYSTADGGPGSDQIIDVGGIGDYISGADGSDCCLGDSNHNFSVLDGGAGGNDRVDQFAGSTQCEVANSVCDTHGDLRCRFSWPQ